MIQGFTSPGSTINMLVEFRESCFQISLVKIPSYNECSLRWHMKVALQYVKLELWYIKSNQALFIQQISDMYHWKNVILQYVKQALQYLNLVLQYMTQ